MYATPTIIDPSNVEIGDFSTKAAPGGIRPFANDPDHLKMAKSTYRRTMKNIPL